MNALRKVILAASLAGLGGPETPCLAGDAPDPGRFEFRQTHMGTEFKIVVYTNDEARARRASRAAFDRVARLDAILSDYNPDSELNRLCARAGGPAVPVSAELFAVLEQAQQIARRSGGAFDVTVKPVVKLWRRARRRGALPESEALASARARVGYEGLVLDPEARTARLLHPDMELDLGGIAKGYAADEALRILHEQGLSVALVAAAGDIVVGDPPPGASGWRVGIAPLDDPAAPPERFLVLTHSAISTSGDSAQFLEVDGRRYSHIVDPKTGLGVVEHASVTVVAPRGILADSLATAVYILGPRRGLEFLAGFEGVEALIVRHPEGGSPEVVTTPGWERLPAAAGAESPPE